MKWWQNAVVYQIYPRSFQDSNGDGIGDLPGIASRLDYVAELGVDCVWLSPIYPSPMADFGYDVSDYTNIHPDFGTLDDFRALLAATHERGLRLIVDMVPNHSSHLHPWFVESRASRDNPKRDWYIWHDPAPDGGPPNNWISAFSGPAWTFDEATGQYYLHSFLPEQPDLNWRNPAVKEAYFSGMRFWLEMGVDGFRVDVIYRMLKDEDFTDEPPNPTYRDAMPSYDSLIHNKTRGVPGIHELIKEFRAVVDEYDDRVMIGEVYLKPKDQMPYYGEDLDECHFPFNFELVTGAFTAPAIADVIADYYHHLPDGAWANWVYDNHDVARITSSSRAGIANAANAALLLLTLGGTITWYYGDEIAMPDVAIPRDRIQDPKALREIDRVATRDTARTPMQWDDSPFAGFSTVEPWLPLDPNHRTCNVAAARSDTGSQLHLVQRLLRLRKQYPQLLDAPHELVHRDEHSLAYKRPGAAGTLMVALNLSDHAHTLPLRRPDSKSAVLVATRPGGMHANEAIALSWDEDGIRLGANEGVLVLID